MHFSDHGALATVAIAILLLAHLAWSIARHRDERRARREAATFEALAKLRTPEYARMAGRLQRLPARLDLAAAEGLDAEGREAVAWFVLHYDSLGLLASRRAVDLRLVDDAVGPDVTAFWRRVEPYVRSRRAAGAEEACRWTEWLATELEAEETAREAGGRPAAW